MRRLALFLVMIAMATAAHAQVVIGGGGGIFPTPIPTPLPTFFPSSNTVMDHDGNVLIFETSFGPLTMLSPLPLSGKTHIVVVSSDGNIKNGYDYNGSFQLVGIGQNAVYAIVTSIGSTATAFTRNLVALRVVAGTLPATLPSVNAGADAKLSPGTTPGEADRIVMVDSILLPVLAPGSPTGTSSPVFVGHTIRLFTSDGTSPFVENKNNPISVQ